MSRPRLLSPDAEGRVVELAGEGLSASAIVGRLASLEQPVRVSRDTVRRALARHRETEARQRTVEEAERLAAACECGESPRPEVHRCPAQGGRWTIFVASDGLVACPQCRRRERPETVVRHLGLARGLRPLDDDDEAYWRPRASGPISDPITAGRW